MSKLSILLAFSAALGATPVAAAAVSTAATVTFTESAVEGGLNPTPGVQYSGTSNASGGLVSSVTLTDFFSQAPSSFSYTYNLLEPGTNGEISDQVTFSGGGLLGTSLFLLFTSDPLNFIRTSYGSINETGSLQSIPLPESFANLTSRYTLSVMASSELEGAVPEPSTWAMMLLGFAGIGLAVRRRRPEPVACLA